MFVVELYGRRTKEGETAWLKSLSPFRSTRKIEEAQGFPTELAATNAGTLAMNSCIGFHDFSVEPR